MPTRHRCGKPQCPRCPQTPRVRQLEPVPRKKPLKSFTEPLVVLCLLRYFFEILPQFHFYPPISVHCRVFLPDPSLFPVPPFPAPCPRSSPSAHPPRFLLRFLPPSPSPLLSEVPGQRPGVPLRKPQFTEGPEVAVSPHEAGHSAPHPPCPSAWGQAVPGWPRGGPGQSGP